MPLEPRIKALVALTDHMPSPPDSAPMVLKRAASARQTRFRWVAIRTGPRVASVDHAVVPVAGGAIMVRVYRPRDGRLPLHVFLHGGGWCIGTLDERDDRCRDLAVNGHCVVASVDYRLAPENQYPTAPEDCYAALCWLVEHADSLDVDPGVVSIGGESAGANLAAVVSLMARDRSGPRLALQMLDVPATDLTMSQPSIGTLGSGYMLTRSEMEAFLDAYIPDVDRRVEPYASPLYAPDLSGLPPAWVMTAEYDPLRDEGEAYAARLRESGIPTEHRRLPGHVHGSFAMTRFSASARAYHVACGRALRAAHETVGVDGGLRGS